MSDQPSRAETLFHEAMQLNTPEARAELLRQTCAGDDAVQTAFQSSNLVDNLRRGLRRKRAQTSFAGSA